MPLSPQNPLLNLEVQSVHHIDTENTINLHGLWSIFSKCADTLQEGRRLENLSWRIYSRETLSPQRHTRISSSIRRYSSDRSLPELSSSLDSKFSTDSDMAIDGLSSQMSGLSTSDGGRKHITPIDLENIVKSVTESTPLEPLAPLPRSLRTTPPPPRQPQYKTELTEPFPEFEVEVVQKPSSLSRMHPESSTSTMATAASQLSQMSNMLEDSNSTKTSGTSIVRGFSKEQISRSRISRSQLAPPQPIYKPSPAASPRATPVAAPVLRKKPIAFMLGGSEGDSSPESLGSRSFLANAASRKITSFKEEVQMIQNPRFADEEAIDDSDDPSDSAIEDDEEDWEDLPTSQQGVEGNEQFKRIDSSTNLTSRRSLITTMMHQQDRAAALQNAASRSTPAIRRRGSSHNGPMGTSPQNEVQLSRARPMLPSHMSHPDLNNIPPSPRTNRRSMLSAELTGSLRKHMLWERQSRSKPTSNKNRVRSEIALSEHASKPHLNPTLRRNETTQFYENGIQDYYNKGW